MRLYAARAQWDAFCKLGLGKPYVVGFVLDNDATVTIDPALAVGSDCLDDTEFSRPRHDGALDSNLGRGMNGGNEWMSQVYVTCGTCYLVVAGGW